MSDITNPVSNMDHTPKTGHQERPVFTVNSSPPLSEELLENEEEAASYEAARRTREEMARIAQRLQDKRSRKRN